MAIDWILNQVQDDTSEERFMQDSERLDGR